MTCEAMRVKQVSCLSNKLNLKSQTTVVVCIKNPKTFFSFSISRRAAETVYTRVQSCTEPYASLHVSLLPVSDKHTTEICVSVLFFVADKIYVTPNT